MTSTDYLLPQLPFGGAEITIVRWLKRVGDPVTAGEPLLVVVNDRVEAALPATFAGIFERALVAEGAALLAGAPIAIIIPAVAANAIDRPSTAESTMRDAQTTTARPSTISPVARNIAKLDDVDITNVRGSGISGRLVKADILAARARQTPTTENQPALSSPLTCHPVTQSPRHPVSLSLVTRHSSLVTRRPSDTYVLTAIDLDLERVAMAITQHGPSFARRRLELSYRVCVALAAVAALPSHPLRNSEWAANCI
jgi:pyruvate dehydrogenase E2 component (dihydrolipoamide acetyltransferase)